MLFNISTSGSTASAMLTHIFNDLGCVCFHGLGRGNLRFLVTDPKVPKILKKEHEIPFTQETMHPVILFQYLRLMQERMHFSKPVGVTHTFFTTSKVKQAVENLSGSHFSIIRDPINRINSQITEKINNLVAKNYPEYQSFGENKLQEIIKKIIEENSNEIELFFNREPFITYFCDYDNITYCEDDELIFFENMFDSSYQNPLLDKIALITQLDKKQIADKISNYNKINQHLHFKIDFSFVMSNDLRFKLRNILKNDLEKIEYKLNVNLQQVYEKVNYEFNIDAIFKKFKL